MNILPVVLPLSVGFCVAELEGSFVVGISLARYMETKLNLWSEIKDTCTELKRYIRWECSDDHCLPSVFTDNSLE